MKSNPRNLSRCISMSTFGYWMHTNFYTMRRSSSLPWCENKKHSPHSVPRCISLSMGRSSERTNFHMC